MKTLFKSKITPPYISAESHNIEVFQTLLNQEKYKSFKLVDGGSVSLKYKNHTIETLSGIEEYSFPNHSAGPFGNDISGQWINAENFIHVLETAGLGWKDIHASSIDPATPNYKP